MATLNGKLFIWALIFINLTIGVSAQTNVDISPVILLPDFLRSVPKATADTTWSFEYYDRNLHRVRLGDLNSVDDIDHVKFYKTYKAPGNRTGYTPYICDLVYRYVQVDTNIWLRAIPETKEMVRYQITRNKPLYVDTVSVLQPGGRKQRTVVCKYFRTEIVKEPE